MTEQKTPYKLAWEAYRQTADYNESIEAMSIKQMKQPYMDNILRMAFDAGYNSKPVDEWIDVKLQPIRVKNLAIYSTEWDIIYRNTYHNNTVIAVSLYAKNEDIKADLFHTKETNIKKHLNYAVELCVKLLRSGIKITFLDGSEKEIAKFSPPLYDKYYRTNPTKKLKHTNS